MNAEDSKELVQMYLDSSKEIKISLLDESKEKCKFRFGNKLNTKKRFNNRCVELQKKRDFEEYYYEVFELIVYKDGGIGFYGEPTWCLTNIFSEGSGCFHGDSYQISKRSNLPQDANFVVIIERLITLESTFYDEDFPIDIKYISSEIVVTLFDTVTCWK